MTLPHNLYLEVRQQGGELTTDGVRLLLQPPGKIDADLKARLIRNKPALIQWLQTPPSPGWGEVPPETLAVDPKSTLAADDLDVLVDYMVRQANRPCPLAAWLLKREGTYFDAGVRDPRRQCRLASRDAATWQLNRSEQDAVALIHDLAEAAVDIKGTP